MIRDPRDLLQRFARDLATRRERAHIEKCKVAVRERHGDVDHHVEDGHHDDRHGGHALAARFGRSGPGVRVLRFTGGLVSTLLIMFGLLGGGARECTTLHTSFRRSALAPRIRQRMTMLRAIMRELEKRKLSRPIATQKSIARIGGVLFGSIVQ